MAQILKLLFIGDVVGEEGVELVETMLPVLKQKYKVDFCVLNGENSHQGKGINEEIVKKFYAAGVDVVTGGDHSFDKHLIFSYMKSDYKLLRPFNYPAGVVGNGYGIYNCESKKVKIAILNLRGQAFFMNPVQCPFRAADYIVPKLKEETNLVFIDFHAEATAEKIAMAWYLDGKVSCIAGTHTHVQTADEQIFPNGTGYITDVGFTGPHDTVIGMDIHTSINRFIYQTPQKYKLGTGNLRINGVLFSLDIETGKTVEVERVTFPDLTRKI